MVTVGVWPSEMGQRALPSAHWMRVDVEKREPFPQGSSTLGNPHPSAGAGGGAVVAAGWPLPPCTSLSLLGPDGPPQSSGEIHIR